MQGLNLSQPGLKHDQQWFRTAVFYEVLVRAFSGDGIRITVGTDRDHERVLAAARAAR